MLELAKIRLTPALMREEIVVASYELSAALASTRLLAGVRPFVTQERAMVLHLRTARTARIPVSYTHLTLPTILRV